MTPVAELAVVGRVTQIPERQSREQYGSALVALARRGKVPGLALSHLAVRVLLFLLGQRPGYFAHQKVIAEAVDSNLTSVRNTLFELRDARLVRWNLIPPHHPLPTGKYTRTNVNQYFVEAEALLGALGQDPWAPPPKTVASTRPNLGAPTGTDPKFEQDPPLPPARPLTSQQRPAAQSARGARGIAQATPAPLEKVLAAWRVLNLGELEDRSVRALRNRYSEGATVEQLLAAVEGANHDEWLRQGRAKSAFAVVFASLTSINRFATAAREKAQQIEAAARQRAAERRAAREGTRPRSAEDRRYATIAVKDILAQLEEISTETRIWGAPGQVATEHH